jgi:predicted RNA-binding protein with PUA-like domain
MKYWLMKSEPEVYSWFDLVKDRKTSWDGVRNFQARNNIRKMEPGDLAFFYHTGDERRILGVMEIVSKPQPEKAEPNFSVVEVAPKHPLKTPISLEDIKSDRILSNMDFIKQARLSVASVTEAQFRRIVSLGGKS